MGHTQLINKMSHNSCIELVNHKVSCPPEEPKRYFHHPYGMAYRINNEWVPCPGYGDESVAPQPPEDRERIPAAEWRPKKPTPPVIPSRVLIPTCEELIDALKFIAGIASIDLVSGGPIGYHAMIHRAYTHHSRKNDEMKRLCHAAVDAATIRRSFGALLMIAEHLNVSESEIVEAFDAKIETNLERILTNY